MGGANIGSAGYKSPTFQKWGTGGRPRNRSSRSFEGLVELSRKIHRGRTRWPSVILEEQQSCEVGESCPYILNSQRIVCFLRSYVSSYWDVVKWTLCIIGTTHLQQIDFRPRQWTLVCWVGLTNMNSVDHTFVTVLTGLGCKSTYTLLFELY